MNCTSCGTPILPGMMHCPTCGTPTAYNMQVQPGTGNAETIAAMNFEPFQEPGAVPLNQQQSTPIPPPPPPNFYNTGTQPGTQPQPVNLYNMGTQQATPYANPTPTPTTATPPYGFATGAGQTRQTGPTMQEAQYAQPQQYTAPQQYPPQQQYVSPQQYPPQQQYMPPPQQYPPPLQPVSPQPPRKQGGLSRGLTITITVLVLLILAGSGIIYYFSVPYPAQLHAQATATVQTRLDNQATGTAQSVQNANATVTAIAQATFTAQQNIYNQATIGSPTVTDSMAQNGNLRWDQYDSSNGGGCVYAGGTYHVKELQSGYFQTCLAQASNFSNFTLQVQMTILSGDYGGMVFRSNPTSPKFYLLQFNANGAYDLYAYVSNNGNDAKSLLASVTTSMKGLNQPNLITLIARGSQLTIFVNKQYVNTVSDSSYATGQIGLVAYYKANSTEVSYSNLQIWKL